MQLVDDCERKGRKALLFEQSASSPTALAMRLYVSARTTPK
jgi:hypothetical protein